MPKGEIISVCVVGIVIGKTYFDVKTNNDCDIFYFDFVARILELVIIKCTFWQGGLDRGPDDVPKAF